MGEELLKKNSHEKNHGKMSLFQWECLEVGIWEYPLDRFAGGGYLYVMPKQNILQADDKGRITLPPEARKKSEGLFTYEIDPQGVVKLKPVVGLVTPDQAYFWTRRWQEGEKEASRNIKEGRITQVPHKKLKKFLAKL